MFFVRFEWLVLLKFFVESFFFLVFVKDSILFILLNIEVCFENMFFMLEISYGMNCIEDLLLINVNYIKKYK